MSLSVPVQYFNFIVVSISDAYEYKMAIPEK